MASSGTISVITDSVDYPCCPYGRGGIRLTNVIGWSVDNSGNISFNLISSSDTAHGYWGICYGSGPYYVRMVPQVSYNNGTSWSNLDEKTHLVNFQCTNPPQTQNYTNTIAMSTTLINQLGTYHLSGNCLLRFLYYMDPAPAPSESNANAFPNSSYSEVTQVPVVVEVDWVSTLKYNANGGTGAPSNQTHTNTSSTSSYNQTVSSTVPTRENYRFEGWADSASATTAQYQPGDTITIQKSSPTKTIYAVWTEFYRPGAVFYSTDDTDPWTQVGEYDSHNRTAGNARILPADGGTVWTEMRTIGAPTELGDTPSIFHDDKWYNQKKLGKE